MKIKNMRLLDRWVGSPISAALTIVRRIRDWFQAMPSEPPKRILFVKLVEQGATVVAEPAMVTVTADPTGAMLAFLSA